ncbi:uncharacterized protein LOC114594588 [Podarcis muralis]
MRERRFCLSLLAASCTIRLSLSPPSFLPSAGLLIRPHSWATRRRSSPRFSLQPSRPLYRDRYTLYVYICMKPRDAHPAPSFPGLFKRPTSLRHLARPPLRADPALAPSLARRCTHSHVLREPASPHPRIPRRRRLLSAAAPAPPSFLPSPFEAHPHGFGADQPRTRELGPSATGRPAALPAGQGGRNRASSSAEAPSLSQAPTGPGRRSLAPSLALTCYPRPPPFSSSSAAKQSCLLLPDNNSHLLRYLLSFPTSSLAGALAASAPVAGRYWWGFEPVKSSLRLVVSQYLIHTEALTPPLLSWFFFFFLSVQTARSGSCDRSEEMRSFRLRLPDKVPDAKCLALLGLVAQ